MKIGRSFRFIFRSPKAWSKLIRGGLFSALFFTVFFAFVVLGYLMRLMCDLLEGRETKLPDWNPLGELFYDGLQPVLITLAFISPIIVLSVLNLYINSPVIFILQAFLVIIISGIFPLSLIHFVTARELIAAFNFTVIFAFIRDNFRRVFSAWLFNMGLGLGTFTIGAVIALAMAVPISLFTSTKTGAIIGFGFGVVGFSFAGFITTIISAHFHAQMYRESKPFNDDKEGAIRASIVMPPSLKK